MYSSLSLFLLLPLLLVRSHFPITLIKCLKGKKVSRIALWRCSLNVFCQCLCICFCICIYCCLFVGQVMFSHDPYQFCGAWVWSGRLSEWGRPRATRAAKNLWQRQMTLSSTWLGLWRTIPCFFGRKQNRKQVRVAEAMTMLSIVAHKPSQGLTLFVASNMTVSCLSVTCWSIFSMEIKWALNGSI